MSKKKFFTLLLALVTALTMSLAGTALAADVWDGTVGTVPAPVNNVITITTGAQLAGFASAVNSGTTYQGYTIRLGNDINLNDLDWTPIGRFFSYWGSNRAFSGIFDGAGHSITGLNVVNDNNNYTNRGETAGLFGYIDFPAATTTRSAANATPVTAAAKAQSDAAALGLASEAYDRVVAERTDLYTAFGVAPEAIQTRSVTPAPAGASSRTSKSTEPSPTPEGRERPASSAGTTASSRTATSRVPSISTITTTAPTPAASALCSAPAHTLSTVPLRRTLRPTAASTAMRAASQATVTQWTAAMSSTAPYSPAQR